MQIKRNLVIPGPHNKPIGIDVFYEENGQPKPIVIFSHGFKGFKDFAWFDLAGQQIAQAGLVFVKFNFSHNGTTIDDPLNFGDLEAFGNNNFSIELDDLGAVIDWALSTNEIPDTERQSDSVMLVGHSRGGGITILKAYEDERVQRIVTWASVNEFGRFWAGDVLAKWEKEGVMYVKNGRTKQDMPMYYQSYEDLYANKQRLDIPTAIENMRVPHLILHGTKDPTVDFQQALFLHYLNPLKTEVIPIGGSDHVFGGKHPWESDQLPPDAERVVDETIKFLLRDY